MSSTVSAYRIVEEYVALPVTALFVFNTGVAAVVGSGALSCATLSTDDDFGREYLMLELPLIQCHYALRVHSLLMKLFYFFIQAPAPGAYAPTANLCFAEAIFQECLRDWIYDRGTVIDELANEALHVNSAIEQFCSFEDYCSAITE